MTYDVIVRITPTKLAAHDRYQVNTQPYQILTRSLNKKMTLPSQPPLCLHLQTERLQTLFPP